MILGKRLVRACRELLCAIISAKDDVIVPSVIGHLGLIAGNERCGEQWGKREAHLALRTGQGL